MLVVVFEDELVAQLEPVTLARPAFAISCGSRRLVDLLAELGEPLRAFVRPHLAQIVKADFPQFAPADAGVPGPVLYVNARLVPSLSALAALRRLVASGRPAPVPAGESIAAAFWLPAPPPATAQRPDAAATPLGPPDKHLAGLGLPTVDIALPLFEYPHDILREHQATIGDHLADRIARGQYREVAPGVFAAAGAVLGPHVVADTKAGPIVLETGATVGAYCYLNGPVHLGPHCRVLEHAAP